MPINRFATPLAVAFASNGDDYCGTVVPNFPFPRGINPGTSLLPAVQKGIIIVSG